MSLYQLKILIGGIALWSMCGCGNFTARQHDREQIMDLLESYREAITSRDSRTVVQLVSEESLERYEGVQELGFV